ncbi:MAG TPA: DUF1223 domain-containing protein [Acidobacteriaceae bacterium]|nr:DUF1223 domain-containing protein [Acidobacteriaceae bacterium]
MRAKLSAGCGVAVVFLLGACAGARAAEPSAGRTPILMELFTSEGCSSCPPIDAWAARLDQFQPIARGQIILLSEHVDYWDHDGWKDPFSSPALTERQSNYERGLGQSNVYTPQVVVDGDVEVHPWKTEEVKSSLDKAALAQTMAVKIDDVALANGELTGKVDADGTGGKHGDVFVAVALEKTETDVLGGENHGKKLTNVGVVQSLVKIGKVEKGKAFVQDFRVKVGQGADAGNLRVVAFVQEPGPGKVLGAAVTKEIGKGGN